MVNLQEECIWAQINYQSTEIIASASMQLNSTLYTDVIFFIPSTVPHLVDICDQLYKRSPLVSPQWQLSREVSIWPSNTSVQSYWDRFAPESFRQHRKLASSTGVVPLSKAFDGLDIEMLIAFMSLLELCFEIIDEQLLDSFRRILPLTEMLSLTLNTSSFQGWLELTLHAEQVWEESCTTLVGYSNLSRPEFFLSSLLSSPHSEDGICAPTCPCPESTAWCPFPADILFRVESGIYWCNDDGITVHLAENGRDLALKMCSDTVRPEGLIHRSKLWAQSAKLLNVLATMWVWLIRNINWCDSLPIPNVPYYSTVVSHTFFT